MFSAPIKGRCFIALRGVQAHVNRNIHNAVNTLCIGIEAVHSRAFTTIGKQTTNHENNAETTQAHIFVIYW